MPTGKVQASIAGAKHHGAWCPCCEKVVFAPFPEDLKAAGLSGPGLTVLVGYLKAVCHASFSTIRKFFRDVLKLHLSRGYLRKSALSAPNPRLHGRTKALEFSSVRLENRRLRLELADRFSLTHIVGKSPAMQELFQTLARVSPSDATVLIEGETGTGKELVARAIHYNSTRNSANFVTVNCTAIPRELLESELFGHTKGGFTGATSAKTGKFELAQGGTIFLDEIGDIDMDLQKKLLRVLQEREIDKVGTASPVSVDVRIIAATNQSLPRLVEEKKFRRDLYYRLSVVPVHLPPLRERLDDIPLLVEHFLSKLGAAEVTITDPAIDLLKTRSWPGNVRELENTIERALILRMREDVIDSSDLTFCKSPMTRESPGVVHIPEGGLVLEDVEKTLIVEALRKTEGNQSAAARLLGISRQTLIYRMQKYAVRGVL